MIVNGYEIPGTTKYRNENHTKIDLSADPDTLFQGNGRFAKDEYGKPLHSVWNAEGIPTADVNGRKYSNSMLEKFEAKKTGFIKKVATAEQRIKQKGCCTIL